MKENLTETVSLTTPYLNFGTDRTRADNIQNATTTKIRLKIYIDQINLESTTIVKINHFIKMRNP